MSVYSGPNTTQSGLVLHIDPSNPRSYPGSGTTIFDISGNGNNGTLTNGPIFNSANSGSIIFDGINDYITFGNILRYQDNFTVEAIARFPNLPNNQTSQCAARHPILSNNEYGYNLQLINTGNVWWGIYDTINSGAFINSINTFVGNYFHAVGIKSGTQTLLYVNGVLQGSANLTTNAVYYINSPLTIGGLYGCGGSNFYGTGNIARVCIYNKALSFQEIINNFNATRGRYGI